MGLLIESPTRFLLVILLVSILKQLTTPCNSPMKMVIIYQRKFHKYGSKQLITLCNSPVKRLNIYQQNFHRCAPKQLKTLYNFSMKRSIISTTNVYTN